MSDSSRPNELQPTRLLRPWDFPGKRTGVGCHCLLRILLYCTLKNSYDCFLVIKRVKRLPAMPETWVQSSGQKNPLEKGMATHSSPLARNSPWTEEPAKLSSPWGHKESQLLSSKPIRLSYSQPSPHPHLPQPKGIANMLSL